MDDIKVIHKNIERFNLLKSKVCTNWSSHNTYLEFINENFKYYLKILKSFEGYVFKKLIDNKEITACLYEKIIKTLCDYLKGKTDLAFSDMDEVYLSIKDILKRKSLNRYIFESELGFKARVINENEPTPTKKDMFHIPFEKRHLIGDNRYSRHGIPSIYLGRTIYDCYIELGSPPIDNFWVSLFFFSQNKKNELSNNYINLIDLSLSTPHKLNIDINYVKKDEPKLIANIDQLVYDILLWPLIFVCSVPCKYPNAPFHEEYIIPQILYKICSDDIEFVGVKYTSTKFLSVNEKIFQRAMDNFALPSQDVKISGYCKKLASQLTLSEPITANHLPEIDIVSKHIDLPPGFIILSNMHNSLKNDNAILSLDKMTLYFKKLVDLFMQNKDVNLISPLNGWKK